MLFCCLLPLLLLLLTSADLRLTSAAADPSEAEFTGAALIEKRGGHRCGGELINALVSVCYQRRRRSGSDTLPMDRWLELPTGDVTSSADMTSLRQRVLQTLFTPHSQERRLYASGQRSKRGIVDECCFKPCSLKTLQMYC